MAKEEEGERARNTDIWITKALDFIVFHSTLFFPISHNFI